MKEKHAYLIMAHNKFDMLINLINWVDDERNDIFIHIDKKAINVPYEIIKNSAKKSGIYFVTPVNVVWGDFSQIRCEMELLKTAVKERYYTYLHLMSGLDLPIKSQDYIHNFFRENNGKEFIDLEEQENVRHIRARCQYYWFLQKMNGRHVNDSVMRLLEGASVRIQRTLKVCRIPRGIEIKKGANWFSITGRFAQYVVNNEKEINRHFKYTLCADEVFLQTMLYNSEFKNNLFESTDIENTSRRLIDWKRGNPYIFRYDDLEALLKSNCLFARKFDSAVDELIIKELEKHVIDKRGIPVI